MSRAQVSKSRADKGKPPASQTPVIAHEIVPGKFNENDWNIMLDRDASQEFIDDILVEIVDNSLDIIYENYIEKQVLPFTICQAKDAILQIIEWQFLDRDEGEADVTTDVGWMQDEEPEPALTDCWAQGSVPRSYITRATPTIFEVPEAEELSQQEETEEKGIEATAEEAAEPELEDNVSDTEEPAAEIEAEEKEMTPEKTIGQDEGQKKKKFKFKPYRGKLKSAGLKNMTESLDDSELQMYMQQMSEGDADRSEDRNSGLMNMPASCHSLLKTDSDSYSQVQARRPPGYKDVVYDELGNVLAVVKLDPEKLPNHRVNVLYQVTDPATEEAQARLEAMRHGKYMAPKIQRISRHRFHKAMSDTSSTMKSVKTTNGTHQPTIAPLPPPLIDAMEISPGVIVKERGKVRKGPGRYVRRIDLFDESQSNLRPVETRIPTSSINVTDLLDRQTPILRPLQEISPLPPIMPHPPSRPPLVS